MLVNEIIYQQDIAQTRIALLNDGDLVGVEYFQPNGFLEGNIYLGKIIKKISLANDKTGYFVDINDSREAFINSEEPNLDELILSEGQGVVVQISQEKRADKGAKVVRTLQFVGSYLVYCPYKMNIEASSKISNAARLAECKEVVVEYTTGQEGWILRTDVVSASNEQIIEEMLQLRAEFDKVFADASKVKAPALLKSKHNPIYDYIKLYKNGLDKLVLNNHLLENELKDITNIEYSKAPFDEYGIDESISEALSQTVKLKSGSRIHIEETKAFVAIDVDSGEGAYNGNICSVNIEAAIEIAKQIMLRNLSGKIIIDFAGMSEYKFLKVVIDVLTEELSKDYVKSTVLGLSRAGNVEVVRHRKRPSLRYLITKPCEVCGGEGRVEK